MAVSLAYKTKGSGPALILLHGNGDSSNYFDKQIDFFADRFQVFALDTRGHGESPRGTAPFTLQQFAEDLKLFFTEHHIEKAHILGFSDGANIAMLFAMRYPEHVDKLILNGGNLCPAGMRLSIYLPVMLCYWLSLVAASSGESARSRKELLHLMARQPRISRRDLKKITAPTLVIAGTKDMIRTAHTKKIARYITGSQLTLLQGNHFIAAKNSEAFNAAVLKFLD